MLPIFLVVLFGMIDYGLYFYQAFAVSAAVRDGIRTGVAYKSTANPDAWTVASTRAKFVLQQSNVIAAADVTFSPATGNQYTTLTTSTGLATKAMTLTATYTFKPLIGFVPTPKVPVSYSMTMLLEQEN